MANENRQAAATQSEITEDAIRAIFEKLGYKDLLSSAWYARINDWAAWYGGKTKFHDYTIYNGANMLSCVRKTLGMAKKACEDKADLLLNEKVTISVTPKAAAGQEEKASTELQDYVNGILVDNDFWVLGNQLIEVCNALGTGAFVEYMDGTDVKIDYVSGTHIRPLKWLHGKIQDCAFVSRFTDGTNGERIYIQLHKKEGSVYVVYNNMYDKTGKQVELPKDVVPVWNTQSEEPLFQLIKPNICNNIDLDNPMGVSIYANAVEELETIDVVYDSFFNEYLLGRKRIFVDDTLVKPNPVNGTLMPVFDPKDSVFYGIPGNGEEGKNPIIESNPELRYEAHIQGLQTALDLYSEKTGFGKGYYKFSAEGTLQTATAVISSNSKLYRRIQKDEIVLNSAITGMVRAVLFLGGKGTDADISINFDDSIIEDTEAIANRAMREVTTGIIDNIIYFQRVYKMTEDAAIELDKKITDRAPEPVEEPGAGGV
jgi:A118 family predicted phage portal protein